MRIRRKPWARPELFECNFFVDDPIINKNKWKTSFTQNTTLDRSKNTLHLELGCGKGVFISKLASQNKDINYMAIDIKSEVLALAKRACEAEYAALNTPIDNLLLMSADIERIDLMMGDADIVDRIYINFCNPCFKVRRKKKRLTHTRQLEKYKTFLSKTAQIHFKTDDDILFEESLEYFEEAGFKLDFLTRDLHSSNYSGNIVTEHEKMFTEQGVKIKFLIASLKD